MIDNLPLNWPNKENSPELEAYFKQFGKKYYFTAEEINELRDSMNQMYGEFLANTDFISPIDLSSPAPTLPGIYIPTVAGTYTNYGGLVVDLTNKISRIIWTGFVFRQQVVGVDVSGKVDKKDINDSLTNDDPNKIASSKGLKNLNDKLEDSFKFGENTANIISTIKPNYKVWKSATDLDSRSFASWYVGISSKKIDTITIPIIKPLLLGGNFTDSVVIKVAFKNVFIHTEVVSLSKINSLGLNATTTSTPINYFLYSFNIPTINLVSGDEIYVGITCKEPNDRLGFGYSDVLKDEWVQGYLKYGNYNMLLDVTPPAKVINGSNVIFVDFGYSDFLETRLDKKLLNFISKSSISNSITEIDESKPAGMKVVKLLNSSIENISKSGETEPLIVKKINTITNFYRGNNVVDSKGVECWFTGIITKVINNISVPIMRRLSDDLVFTDSVYLKVGLNGLFIFEKEITLAEINVSGLNATTIVMPDSEFYINFNIPTIEFKTGDILYMGISCKSPTDKMGFPSSTNTNVDGEWKRLSYRYNISISAYTSPPSKDLASKGYTFGFKFSYLDYIQKKIETYVTNNAAKVGYSDISYTRNKISSFLTRVQLKENLKVVFYGDSIINFQNSETLTLEEQKTAPIGLCGNSVVRKTWQALNYDVFNKNRTEIINPNGNLGFKRFDHGDCFFSNGYQKTKDVLGAFDWGTNRNDETVVTWRGNGFDTGFAQSIMPDSSYNKPMVGTKVNGATFNVTIPSNAIGCSIVFGRGTIRSNNVSIKVNDGTTDIINEVVNLVTAVNVIELHKDFTLSPGTIKTITVTNNTNNELWIWGVEYWSKNSIRVINSAKASGNSGALNGIFEIAVTNQNPDFIIIETPTGNDSLTSIATFNVSVIQLMNKLKALNIPILSILCHRFVGDNRYVNRLDTPDNIIGVGGFWGDYTKTFKSLSYQHGFGLIDMYRKSMDEIGDKNNSVAPVNYFVDEGHLGVIGNNSYFEEIKKVIYWDELK